MVDQALLVTLTMIHYLKKSLLFPFVALNVSLIALIMAENLAPVLITTGPDQLLLFLEPQLLVIFFNNYRFILYIQNFYFYNSFQDSNAFRSSSGNMIHQTPGPG